MMGGGGGGEMHVELNSNLRSLSPDPVSAVSLWYGAGESGGEGGSGGRGTLTCGPAEPLEVVDEVVGVVGAGEGDLEVLVAGDEGGEAGQALLARAAHAHEDSVAPVRADDARDLDQVDHGILEEHEVHAQAPHHVLVLLHVAHQLLREELQGRY